MADVTIDKIDEQIKAHEEALAKLRTSARSIRDEQARLAQGFEVTVEQINRRLGAISSLKALKGEVSNINEGAAVDEPTEDEEKT